LWTLRYTVRNPEFNGKKEWGLPINISNLLLKVS
jgi:hypothetical protein